MASSIKKIGIIGGGPAGLATAIQLKKHNFEVLLFEASKHDQITIGEHLAAEAMHEFKKLGIPNAILKNNSIPCTEVQNAWGDANIHHNESIFNPFGEGFVLSRPDFDAALFKYCSEIGVDTKLGSRISKIDKTATGWNLHVNNTRTSVDFIIDASGRNSKFNFDSSLKKEKENQLIGITKQLAPRTKNAIKQRHLLVESTKNGWWYTVQVDTGMLISTFMTDANLFKASTNSSSDFWNEQLADSTHTKARLNAFDIPQEAFIKSAHSHLANHVFGDHWLKVGDAAQSFDPLSSAGILKGLKMGQQAAAAIYKYAHGKADAFKLYENEITSQHQEYTQAKANYYANETRWMQHSFWYQRNLKLKNIQHFTITPISTLKVSPIASTEKLAFLQQQLPAINFKILLQCLAQNALVKDALFAYLQKTNTTKMSPWLLHALESFKIIGLLSTAVKKVEINERLPVNNP